MSAFLLDGPPPRAQLSPAEARVVERRAAGARLDEIARERGVSRWTIANQLKSARAKLGGSIPRCASPRIA